jgi:Holliday junction resolvase RusA-like endonuclease
VSLMLPTSYDSLIAVTLNALRVQLPGTLSWRRPRGTIRAGQVRSAYPEDYVQGREAWRLVVEHAVRETGWAAPPVEAALMVEVEVVAQGKRDLDRIVTAVLDALQGGHALVDDCRCWEIHAVRRRPARGELPHVDAVLSLADTRPLRGLKEVS